MITRAHKRRGVLLGAALLVLISCGASGGKLRCTSLLTCAWHDERFIPPAAPGLETPVCDAEHKLCVATQISAGGDHSCAIAAAGELICWGDNSEAQLGPDLDATEPAADAGIDLSRFPIALRGATRIAAGAAHTCALSADGLVRCWGRNLHGQVNGHAEMDPVTTPQVVDVQGATQLAAGAAHSCAVVADGVMCWGSARYGQVGRELSDAALAPGVVPDTEGAVEVATGARHTCARFDSGAVKCWGELYAATPAVMQPTTAPTLVPGIDAATAIAAGAGHSCAIEAAGDVVCWGSNASGQLGSRGSTPSARPTRVPNIRRALRLAAGGGELDGRLVGHTCVVDTRFNVVCWGRNREGQLGAGMTESSMPVAVLGRRDGTDSHLGNVAELALGAFHSCARHDDGPITCWGDDSFDQLGASARNRTNFGRAERVARFGSIR